MQDTILKHDDWGKKSDLLIIYTSIRRKYLIVFIDDDDG